MQRQSLVATLVFVGLGFSAFNPALAAPRRKQPKPDVDTNTPASTVPDTYPHRTKDAAAPAEENDETATPPPRRRAERPSEEDYDEPSAPARWGLGLQVGLGSGAFYARVAVSYYLNPYMALDTIGFYRSYQDDKASSMHFGPEVDLRLLLPNRTRLTPFVGAGPGYEKWRLRNESGLIEDAASMTTRYFVGLSIGLSKFISLDLSHSTRTYLQDPPLRLSKPTERNKRTTSEIGIDLSIKI